MDLQDYISNFPRKERTAERRRLAEEIGVSESLIRHYVNGIRTVPGERVLKLEKATNRQVTRYEIRPDIYPPDEIEAA